jgi:hypothetical protein
MGNIQLVKLTYRLGIILLLLGLGISFSGMMGMLLQEAAANKATMVGGLVLAAVGYIMVAMQNVLTEDF